MSASEIPSPSSIAVQAADPQVQPALAAMDDLDRQLERLVEEGRAAHPGVALAVEALAVFVAERLPLTPAEVAAHVRGLGTTDIYFAAACAQGERAAQARFRDLFASVIAGAVRSIATDEQQVDDVIQRVMERVILGEKDRPAKIAQFTGRGRLKDWVRVVARREALQILRRKRREVPMGQDLLGALGSPAEDLELDHMRRVYRDRFKAAFAEAMADLTAKQRVLLRFKVIDGLNIEQIGRMQQVHRATVARWLAEARRRLLVETRARLMLSEGLTPSEFESVTRLVRSQLDLSIFRLLGAASGPDSTDA